MEYSEYAAIYGPRTPIVKPLDAPTETPPELSLTPTNLTEDDFRKVLSCPTGLKILKEEPECNENDDFEMIDENSEKQLTSPMKGPITPIK